MDNKILEIFIPGPAGRLEAKYYKSKKNTSPIALVLQPHPQYGGTMNNKVVVDTFHTFMDNDFSVCRVNFRGVGKSDGEFDNGQGELADAAAALDWLERENFDNSQCWVAGFSFGSLISMQLLMRRPEISRFISISPQPNVYDFSFLSPCPTSGTMIYGKKIGFFQKLTFFMKKKTLKMLKFLKDHQKFTYCPIFKNFGPEYLGDQGLL